MVFLVSNIFFSPKNKNVLHLCFQNIKSYGSRNILRVQNFPLFYFVRFWIWIWICDATCDLSGLGLFCSIWCLRTFSFAPKRAGREVLSRNPTFADFSSSKSLKYKTSKLTIKLDFGRQWLVQFEFLRNSEYFYFHRIWISSFWLPWAVCISVFLIVWLFSTKTCNLWFVFISVLVFVALVFTRLLLLERGPSGNGRCPHGKTTFMRRKQIQFHRPSF